MKKSSTKTLIGAMRILAEDIQGGDGTANAAILEAAERLEQFEVALHDAVRRPKGVVPDSADGLYRQDYWDSPLSRFVNDTTESEKADIYDEVMTKAVDEQNKMKYHESPFHVTHDKKTADAMCKEFNPKP